MQSYNNGTLNQMNRVNPGGMNNNGGNSNFIISIVVAAILLIGAVAAVILSVSNIKFLIENIQYQSEFIYTFLNILWTMYNVLMVVGAVLAAISLVLGEKLNLNLLQFGALAIAAANLLVVLYEIIGIVIYTDKLNVFVWLIGYLITAAAWGIYGALKLMQWEELLDKLRIAIIAAAAVPTIIQIIHMVYWYNRDGGYYDSFIQYAGACNLILLLAFPIALILIVLLVDGDIALPAMASGGVQPPVQPQAGGGFFPQSGGGSAPQPAGGSAPQPAGGSAPQPAGGSAPQPAGGSAPQPGGGSAPQPAGGGLDAAAVNALREYKGLLDDGIISQEEFDALRKQMLGL